MELSYICSETFVYVGLALVHLTDNSSLSIPTRNGVPNSAVIKLYFYQSNTIFSILFYLLPVTTYYIIIVDMIFANANR